MTKTKFDPPSEPPDGDPVCRICDKPLEWTLVGWECTHDHDEEEENTIDDSFLDHRFFISWAYERHCKSPHNADFEVCSDPVCRIAIEFESDAKKELEPEHIWFIAIVRRGVQTPMALVDPPQVGGFRQYGKWHPSLLMVGVTEFEEPDAV